MLLKELLSLINTIMPPETAMEGDKIGLQIDAGLEHVNKVLIALEMTDEVVEEAIANKSDCMIVFHPLIFMPLKKIQFDERVGRITSKLIKNDIALISVHTAYDAYLTGTNKILADLLGLEIIQKLVPDQNYDGHGMGVLTKIKEPIEPEELLDRIHDKLGTPLRYTEGKAGKIYKVAIVGGSGSSFISDALKSKADAFITADITYHTFHALKDKIWIIDPGHYEMEQFVGKGIAELIANKLIEKKEKLDLIVSRVHTNPVRYYPETERYIEKQKELLNK